MWDSRKNLKMIKNKNNQRVMLFKLKHENRIQNNENIMGLNESVETHATSCSTQKRITKDLSEINLTRKKLKHNLLTSNNELR